MGKTLAIIGHRPGRLYGYTSREPYNNLLTRIQGDLRVLIDAGFDTFILDGSQGASQIAFWAIEGLRRQGCKVNAKLHIPYKGIHSRWNESGLFSQAEYRQMLSCTKDVKYFSPYVPRTKEDAVKTMQDCAHSIIDSADIVYAIYQGTSENYRIDRSGTAEALRYARTRKKEILLTMPHQPEPVAQE